MEHSKAKIEVILGDIRDFDSVLKASQGYKNIIHLAALIGCIHVSPLAYIKTNVEGTYNVLECAKMGKFEKCYFNINKEVMDQGLIFQWTSIIDFLANLLTSI